MRRLSAFGKRNECLKLLLQQNASLISYLFVADQVTYFQLSATYLLCYHYFQDNSQLFYTYRLLKRSFIEASKLICQENGADSRFRADKNLRRRTAMCSNITSSEALINLSVYQCEYKILFSVFCKCSI